MEFFATSLSLERDLRKNIYIVGFLLGEGTTILFIDARATAVKLQSGPSPAPYSSP